MAQGSRSSFKLKAEGSRFQLKPQAQDQGSSSGTRHKTQTQGTSRSLKLGVKPQFSMLKVQGSSSWLRDKTQAHSWSSRLKLKAKAQNSGSKLKLKVKAHDLGSWAWDFKLCLKFEPWHWALKWSREPRVFSPELMLCYWALSLSLEHEPWFWALSLGLELEY